MFKTVKAIQNHQKPSKPSTLWCSWWRAKMIILCIMWTRFRYLLHFAVTRRLEICRYISIRHDVKMCQKSLLQIVWSTLGRSLKLDPQPSNSSFYKKQLGFNTKVNKGTFCYKCLCPIPWEKNKSYGICRFVLAPRPSFLSWKFQRARLNLVGRFGWKVTRVYLLGKHQSHEIVIGLAEYPIWRHGKWQNHKRIMTFVRQVKSVKCRAKCLFAFCVVDSPSYLLQGTTLGNSWPKFHQVISSPLDT